MFSLNEYRTDHLSIVKKKKKKEIIISFLNSPFGNWNWDIGSLSQTEIAVKLGRER